MKRALYRRSLVAAAAMLAATAWSARAQENSGVAALREACRKVVAAKSMTADLAVLLLLPNGKSVSGKGTLAALKPNFLRVELKGVGAGGTDQVYASDGKFYYSYYEGSKAYRRAVVPPVPLNFLGQWEGEIDTFFGGERSVQKGAISVIGSEKVGEIDCDVVKLLPQGRTSPIAYFIGKTDRLIHRSLFSYTTTSGSITQINTLSNLQLDVAKMPDDFLFTLPEGARLIPPAAPRQPGP